MGKLFIIATPIGNLEDITLRALQVLKDVNVILAEDTRATKNLLRRHNIDFVNKEIVSFFEGNEESRTSEIIIQLQLDKNIALVSEAGTPLISDPGFKLVRKLLALKIPVEAIPGPTALITALTLSGLPTNAFVFLGYLPKREGKALGILKQVKKTVNDVDVVKTIIFYESPHRLLKTLNIIKAVFGDTNIVVARELTKMHEEVRREKISESIKYFSKVKPRGEFVLLLAPSN